MVVRRPSGCEKTRCEVPRSACSRKPIFFKARMSLAAETRGALGMGECPFGGGNGLKQLKPGIVWDMLAVRNETPDVGINRIACHRTRFINRLSPRVTAAQCWDIRVIAPLVLLKNNPIGEAFHSPSIASRTPLDKRQRVCYLTFC